MVYKSNVGDFPLKVHPCEYWWVRYAVACVRNSELFNKKMYEKLKELEIENYSYTGKNSDPQITLYRKDQQPEKINRNSKFYDVVYHFINDAPEWDDCQYENGDQSTCPNYSPSRFYKNTSIEELRQRKGYDV